MNIVVTHLDGDDVKVKNFVLDPSAKIETLKIMIEFEMKIPQAKAVLYFNGKLLVNSKTLEDYAIGPNDCLEVKIGSSKPTLATIPPEMWSNPAELQAYIKSRPSLVNELLNTNPTLAEAVMSPTPQLLIAYMQAQRQKKLNAERKQQLEIARLNADPFDLEAQARIAEMIRLGNVQQNMEMAMEYNPEAFARVIMLYVPAEVNGVKLKAFVDSGAQSTIMSVDCAKRCGIMRLVDKKFAGIAKGVGTAKIVGRVHSARLKLGNTNFDCSFTILEGSGCEFLFGLDQLKKHRACIDLKTNSLNIGDEKIPFLGEADIPKEESQLGDGSGPQLADLNQSSSPSSSASSTSSSTTSSSSPATCTSTSQPTASASSTSTNITPSTYITPSTRPSSDLINPANQSNSSRPIPPHSASSSTTSTTPTPAPSSNPTLEANIQLLMNMGFSRQQSMQALAQMGGNVDMAASLLFQSGMF